jgi:hypothetical protein
MGNIIPTSFTSNWQLIINVGMNVLRVGDEIGIEVFSTNGSYNITAINPSVTFQYNI